MKTTRASRVVFSIAIPADIRKNHTIVNQRPNSVWSVNV